MIPFHLLYSWLFKSFRISSETDLVDKLIAEWFRKIMIVKRSWIFALFVLWLPLFILGLSFLSMWIAYESVTVDYIRYTIIIGNFLMSSILVISSWRYIRHFYKNQSTSGISTNPAELRAELHKWDTHFIRFFNASVTNQWILSITLILEIILVFAFQKQLWNHFWILTTDTLVILVEIVFLRIYRKKMMDLEMDYNVVVPGKVFFVNQSGILSSVQTIESDKIKTVRSSFPSKIASFFNYGTVDILTEGDTQAMMGTMSMYYVTNPDGVVSNIQSLLDEKKTGDTIETPEKSEVIDGWTTTTVVETKKHTLDTREKIRDVLR